MKNAIVAATITAGRPIDAAIRLRANFTKKPNVRSLAVAVTKNAK